MPFNRLLTATFYPPEFWRVEQILHYTPNLTEQQIDALVATGATVDKQTGTISVPKNFLSDLASIPRWCWWLIAPFDVARAAVVHDYLYRQMRENDTINGTSRMVADYVFLQAMNELWPKVPFFRKHLIYLGVRIFGWIALRHFNKELPDPAEYNNR